MRGTKIEKVFTAIDATRLIGNVLACTQVCQWLRWSLHHLVAELKQLLCRNMARLAKSKHFQELLAEIDERWMDPPSKTFARITLLNRSFLSKVWHCQAVTYISRQIREEIAFVLQQCQEHLLGTHCWKRPISHIVCQRPDAYA